MNMTEKQSKYLLGYGKTGRRKGSFTDRNRRASTCDPSALETLKEMLRGGQVDITSTEAAKILGGRHGRFSILVKGGYIKRGATKQMDLDSLMCWVAKGVGMAAIHADRPSRTPLDWMRDDNADYTTKVAD